MKMRKLLRNEINVQELIEVVREVHHQEVRHRDHHRPRHLRQLPPLRLRHLLRPKIVQIEINQENVRGLLLLSFSITHTFNRFFFILSDHDLDHNHLHFVDNIHLKLFIQIDLDLEVHHHPPSVPLTVLLIGKFIPFNPIILNFFLFVLVP